MHISQYFNHHRFYTPEHTVLSRAEPLLYTNKDTPSSHSKQYVFSTLSSTSSLLISSLLVPLADGRINTTNPAHTQLQRTRKQIVQRHTLCVKWHPDHTPIATLNSPNDFLGNILSLEHGAEKVRVKGQRRDIRKELRVELPSFDKESLDLCEHIGIGMGAEFVAQCLVERGCRRFGSTVIRERRWREVC